MTQSLKNTLLQARADKRAAFIPFVMAGDPGIEESADIIIALEKSGAQAIELGVPFSDPVADGETVQRAHERALAAGMHGLQNVLDLVRHVRGRGVTLPICLFSYLNPVYQMGYAAFVKAAQDAGAQGALLVDLPPEEAAEYCKAANGNNFETVFLASPTTSPERLQDIARSSTGFVYYISREGVTGAQAQLPQNLAARLEDLRGKLSCPVAVGFGISSPEHMRALEGKADGIVVGSFLIKAIEENPAGAAVKVGEKARYLLEGK